MEIKNYTVDGLRHIEKIITNNNETFVEHYEEIVPMKLTKKVSIKTIQVPVEEKTEIFNEDGSVDTNIKSIPMENYNLVESKQQKNIVAKKQKNIIEPPTIDDSVVDDSVVDDSVVDKSIPIESIHIQVNNTTAEKLTVALWIVIAIMTAFIIYSTFPI